MTTTHITPREAALERENTNMMDTINKQCESIQKLRKVVEMKDLTIDAQTAEIAASERNLEQLTDELVQSRAAIAALKAQPVQPTLTDEQILHIWHNSNPTAFEALSFARAIEAAVRTGGAG